MGRKGQGNLDPAPRAFMNPFPVQNRSVLTCWVQGVHLVHACEVDEYP
jgi:hypothetical protein